ncbi:MAG TPA: Hpt domain-containing protein [Steroidobacteraceae bacterium]|nr:Hpt domain-containing protein [Steroidobacteraceae bacterium]
MPEVASQTLDFVGRELNVTLAEARTALENYVEQPDNVNLLERCTQELHQVQGVLRVLEIYGAALLAEEMEQVASYLLQTASERKSQAESLDALMRAMVQLPSYLERVLAGGRDLALVLLPLLNDLRAVRGSALLSEGTLLLLNLKSDKQAHPVAASPGEPPLTVEQWARRLRARFQVGLIGWIRGERIEQNLDILAAVAQKLEQIATRQPVFQLWWVTGAVIEALQENGLEGGVSIKRLLGLGDREIRRLYEQGEPRYAQTPAVELLNNLLYYVGRAESSGPRVMAVRASFRLSELLPVDESIEQERENLSAPSVKLMQTVAIAIREDLSKVKDVLDIFVRRGAGQPKELASQVEMLRKIGDTLGVLGLGELRGSVQVETERLQKIVDGTLPPDEGTLVQIAATLISVEDRLDGQLVGLIRPKDATAPEEVEDNEFQQVQAAVLRECILNLARIKEAITQNVGGTLDAAGLDSWQDLMRGLKAGLLMLGKARAVEVIEGVTGQLKRVMQPGGQGLPHGFMDRLADAIVSVEYYMETLQAGRSDPWYMLDNAQACVQALEHQQTPALPTLPAVEPSAYARTLQISPSSVFGAETDPSSTLVGSQTPPTTRSAPPLAETADPELIKLFIEEAHEELAKIKKFFPAWDQNPMERDSLITVRRSFHTLKGSGRMVGARELGEFAWSIENLLNRLLDNTLTRSPPIVEVLRDSVNALPELVEQLETGRAPRVDAASIAARATALAAGKPLPAAGTIASGAPAPGAAASAASVRTQVIPPPANTGTATFTAPNIVPMPPAKAAAATPPTAPSSTSSTVRTPGPTFAQVATGMDPPRTAAGFSAFAGSTGVGSTGLAGSTGSATHAGPAGSAASGSRAESAGAGTRAGLAGSAGAAARAGLAGSASSAGAGTQGASAAPGAFGADRNSHTQTIVSVHPAGTSTRTGSTTSNRSLSDDNVGLAEESLLEAPSGEIADSSPSISESFSADSDAPEPTEPESSGSDSNAANLAADLDNLDLLLPEEPAAEESIVLEEESPVSAGAEAAASQSGPDDVLRDIYSRETANHVATVRAYLDREEGVSEPHAIPEDVYRACHTLSGSSKMAQARHGIRLAEPLDHWLRRVFNSGLGLLNQDLSLLADCMVAMEAVVSHLDEVTGYFQNQFPLQERIAHAEKLLDQRIAKAAEEEQSETSIQGDEDELSAADSGDFDPEVAAIFCEEAMELIEFSESALSDWRSEPGSADYRAALKRPLHTLKGGARMAGITGMGDLSHELETLVMQVDNGSVPIDDAMFDVIQASLDELARMRESVANGRRVSSARQMIARIHSLTKPRGAVLAAAAPTISAAPVGAPFRRTDAPGPTFAHPPAVPPAPQSFAPPPPALTPAEQETPAAAASESPTDAIGESAYTGFGSSGVEATATDADAASAYTRSGSTDAGAASESAAHEHRGFSAFSRSSEPDTSGFEVSESELSPDEETQLNRALTPPHSSLPDTLTAPLPPFDFEPVGSADPASGDLAAELLASYPTPSEQSDEQHTTGDAPADGEPGTYDLSGSDLAELTGEHSLSDSGTDRAESADSHVATDYMVARDSAANEEVTPVQSWTPESTQETPTFTDGSLPPLSEDQPGGPSSYEPPTAETFGAAATAGEWPVSSAGAPEPWSPTPSPQDTAESWSSTPSHPTSDQWAPPASPQESTEQRTSSTPQGTHDQWAPAESPQSGSDQWAQPPAANEPPPAFYESPAAAPEQPTFASTPDAAAAATAAAAIAAEQAAAAQAPPVAPPPVEQPAAISAPAKSVSVALGRTTEPKSNDDPLLPPQAVPPGREPVAPAERQEMARVDAELLDQLLNISGEASIARSRLEQQLGSIDFNLGELSRTVTRLKEQLRNLEIETEAQILHRHEDESTHRGDFDPLELDRYSSIQQFSRALAETANDVGSIQQLLENLGKETQNLLQQQARTITELQNGLMRTRMVPFQRHVQRLSRIVRQAANDTGKKAELVVEGASGELDRQVLERMLPPFEHMLRNAVVHGIEKPKDRIAAGKSEAGRIVLELHREGAEVMVRLIDDGGGMNLKAIRDKGAALGLIPPGQTLSDEDAMQLILEPGFSTAGTITQQAGRGVGMDVVATEIKRLGGALHMETKSGEGTVFTIRLPFTLAISHALVVRTGDEFYALPLPTVEGVLRLSKAEVLAHLGKDASAFDYGGQKYRFQHLAAFVALEPSPLPEQDVTIPVVLVRAGEHSTGLVADELVGSREIVVKSVGPQISSIRGISGATILGDGRIVIILDIGALVRAEWRGRAQPVPVVPKDKSDKRTFAMVVDDSITVRRVTQRLLERNGMRVLTARDGMDAVTLLQDNIPDVILLDIEMPRMDGYEVAAHVRNDPRLKDVPIIMITSRVGEKHRARAIELGVDDYLGKPYQEAQLLDAIAPLVERRRATQNSGTFERLSDARV